MPALGLENGRYWIIDDSGHPKYGKHSVEVAHHYCGNVGKTANCQVAVSLSLATTQGSVPRDYRLYLPKDWVDDPVRRAKTGVPKGTVFATKPQIALTQIKRAVADGVPAGVVLADAAYGDETAWRDEITALGLPYMVGIRPATTVWANGREPLPPKPWSGRGAKPKLLRCAPGHEPFSVAEIAGRLPADAWQHLTWREGTNAPLSSRFACVRVRPAHHTHLASELRPEEWLLIGPNRHRLPITTGSRRDRQTPASTNWCLSPRCGGVSNAITGNSSRSLACPITRGATGEDSTTMPPCALPHTAS
jgi:SRSO17 transposase